MALSYINNKEIKFGSAKPLNGVYTPGSPTREYEPLDSLGIYLNSGIPLSYGVENGRYMSMSDEFVATSQGNSYSFNQLFAAQMMLGFKLHDRFIACDTEHKIIGTEPLLHKAYLAEITEKTLDYFKIKIYEEKTRTFCIRMSSSEVPTSYVDLTNSFDENGLNLTQTDRQSFLSYYRFYPLTARDPSSRAEETLGVDYYLLPSAEGLKELSGDILSKFNAFISSDGALTSLGNTTFAYAGDINYVPNYRGETSEAAVSAAESARVILGQVEEMHADINQILPEMEENLELTKQYRDEAMSTEIGTVREDLNQLKGDLGDLTNIGNVWHEGGFISNVDKIRGQIVSHASYSYTDLIVLPLSKKIKYKVGVFNSILAYCIYNKDGKPLSYRESESSSIEVIEDVVSIDIEGAYGIRFSSKTDKIGYLKFCSLSLDFSDESVTTKKIANSSVNTEKIDFKRHDINSDYISGWLSDSYINDKGDVKSYPNMYATLPIYVEEGKSYYRSTSFYNGYWAIYKADGTVIEAHGTNYKLPNPITIPTGGAYIRLTCINETDKNNAWISLFDKKPIPYGKCFDNRKIRIYADGMNITNPCDYTGNEISTFTKCLCIGDSLTSGTFNHRESGDTQYVNYEKYSYPNYLGRMTGLQITNMGNGGQTSAEWYSAESNKDLSGYDIAIIQLGVNDVFRYTTFGDTSKTAFTNIINKLKTENNNIKIFVANIVPAMAYDNAQFNQFSADLLEWVQTVYTNDKNVIALDMHQYAHTKDLDAYNCGHFSALGYQRLAQDYKGIISYYMVNNPSVFKEIQFIGTDYWYDNPNT